MGADIVNPLNKENVLRIKENYTSNLEKEIDLILPTFTDFKILYSSGRNRSILQEFILLEQYVEDVKYLF